MAEDTGADLLPRVFALPGDRLSDAECVLVPREHGRGGGGVLRSGVN